MAHNGTQENTRKDPVTAEISEQGFLVTYRLKTASTPSVNRRGGGKRGKVTGFSKASRWRLLKQMATVQWGRARLITLTYPSDVSRETLLKNRLHLKAFVERWRRHYGYRPAFVWRKEYTKAGIVHFHLLQPKPMWHDDLIKFVSHSWAEILAIERSGDVEKAGTKVEFAKSTSQSMSYVAKYVAKSAESFPRYHQGRVWGFVGKENFTYEKRRIYPIPVSEFFRVKGELERKFGFDVFARKIDRLRKWW